MRLEHSQKQALALSPKAIQSARILQMGIQELRDYVEQQSLENPVLELSDPVEEPLPAPGALGELMWLESSDRQNIYYHRQDSEDEGRDPLANLGQVLDEEADLERYILSQFLGTELESQVMEAVSFLVGQLDEAGWLSEDMERLTALSGLPRSVMERALTELQAAEPAGVGARDLAECLRLQIQRRAGDHRLAIAIVERCLPDLARGRYGKIARALGASEGEVRNAGDFVRALNPRPATGFSAGGRLSYIIPDVVVTRHPDHLELSLNTFMLPRLGLNGYYLELLKTTGDREVRSYLTERTRQAKWVVKSVQQRHDTLLRCVQYMAQRQEGFFRQGPGHLTALTMEQAAGQLELHVSTVSRAVKDKYFQCDWGVYPLSYLFSRCLNTGESSAGAAKALLKRLIEEETRPLSDRELSEEMARQGCPISRRVAAKYRGELNIPAASARKK